MTEEDLTSLYLDETPVPIYLIEYHRSGRKKLPSVLENVGVGYLSEKMKAFLIEIFSPRASGLKYAISFEALNDLTDQTRYYCSIALLPVKA